MPAPAFVRSLTMAEALELAPGDLLVDDIGRDCIVTEPARGDRPFVRCNVGVIGGRYLFAPASLSRPRGAVPS